MTTRALLLDKDGTMVDSERVMLDLYAQIAQRRGWQIDRAVAESTVGTTYQRTAEILTETYPGIPNEEINAELVPAYMAMIDRGEVPAKPGLFPLLNAAKAKDIPVGVCSSSPREIVTRGLRACGALEYIGEMVCAGEAARSKPDPAPYLLLADHMGVPIDTCLVIEDSPHGAESALAAGAGIVCVIPDFVPVPEELLPRVRVLSSLYDAIALL